MKNKNGIMALLGILLFASLIAAAILLQSAYLLYAASVVPFLLVPFLPDIPSSQRLKANRVSGNVRIFRTGISDQEGFVVVEFKPGTILWHKRRLYFSIKGVETIPGQSIKTDAASVPVLPYDLIKHPRRKYWYGIRLNHLVERLHTFSFTTEEVTRLVIRLEDLDRSLASHAVPRQHSAVGQGLEA